MAAGGLRATLSAVVGLLLCCVSGFGLGGLPSAPPAASRQARGQAPRSICQRRGGSSPLFSEVGGSQGVPSTGPSPPPNDGGINGQDAGFGAAAAVPPPPPPPKRSFLHAFTPGGIRDGLRGLKRFLLIVHPVETALLKSKVVSDPDLVRFLARSVAFITYTLGLTSALGTLGIDTKPLVAGISVSGFVIGFTLKEVATNVLAGLALVLSRPFRAGWKIKVGSFQGTVISIDTRYVRLETESKEVVLIPSSVVYGSAITVVSKSTFPHGGSSSR